jgi:FkbM family methyltransferase
MKPFLRNKNLWRTLGYGLKKITAPRSLLSIDLPGQGLRFELPTESLFARHLFKYHIYEPLISNWLIQNAARFGPGLLIDIGANFGWYSCILGKLLPDRNILAYEPEPDNFALLERQISLNTAGQVKPFHLGLGESSGLLKLHKYKASNSGRHSLLPLHDGESVDVAIQSLDEHLRSLGLEERPIALMKIDIEGYELFALRGAQKALARTRLLVMEYSPDLMKSAGLDPHALLALIEAQGFTAARFVSRGSSLDEPHLQSVDFQALRAEAGQMDLLLSR